MQTKRNFSILLALAIILTSFQLSLAVDLDNLTDYHMNLTLDTEKHMVYGEQIVEIINSYNSDLKELVFHLYPDSYSSYETMPAIGGMFFIDGELPELSEEEIGYIEIEAVHINNSENKFTSDKQILKIPMEEPLKTGESVKVKIKFKLKIPGGRERLHHQQGEYSLTNWYPLLSVYNEKTKKWDENPFHPVGESNYSDVANYNVKLTVPKNMVVAPTGSIVEEKIEEENKVVNIKAEKVRDFVILMSPNYKVKTKEVDGIKISNYYMLNEHSSKKTADMVLDEVVNAVKFMNETIGKYSYDELRIVETHLSGGAMEYPQVIQMGVYHNLGGENIEKFAPFIIEAAVHETMHQWWYVGVGNNEYKEPFLDESLTVYMTAYYFEKEYDKYHQNGIDYQIRRFVNPSNSRPLNSSVDDFNEWGEYSRVIYNDRGPAFFEDLRQRVGEEKFIEFLQKYYEKYLFKNATIDGLIETIGEVAGKEIKDIMKKAVNDFNYYPKNIRLNEEEMAEFSRRDDIQNLKDEETNKGLITGSIILRVLEGEDLIIVKPDYTEGNQNINFYIQNLVNEFKYNYGLDLKVMEESKLTEKDKKENLLLIGYPEKHNIMKELAKGLPINIYDEKIKINEISIENKGLTGAFIAENPNNKNKLIYIIFLDEEKTEKKKEHGDGVVRIGRMEGGEIIEYNPAFEKYNLMNHTWQGPMQFIIDVDGVEIKGMY